MLAPQPAVRPRALPLALVALAALVHLACSSGPASVEVDPSMAPPGPGGAPPAEPTELQRLLESLEGPALVRFAAGDYHLAPVAFVDESCANCAEPLEREIDATRGLLLSGEGLVLEGPTEGEAVIRTHSGYGILLDGCRSCELRSLTITDGQRDWEPQASNAAIVVKRSTATIEGCTLRDNLGEEERVRTTVVGIAGVAGREGSETLVRDNRILRNSWDGIALYGGARAEIFGNLIDGVDAVRGARSGNASGGRGVGIGLTWDSSARIEGNLVRRYWKGIGVFVDARAELRRNVVEQVMTWGISLWDAGTGRPGLIAQSNVVHRSGACGASLRRTSPLEEGEIGSFVGNALVLTGIDPAYDEASRYCTQEALAIAALPEGFLVVANLFHANREPGAEGGLRDQPLDEFQAGLRPLLEELAAESVLRDSDFFEQWGGSFGSR